MPMKQRLPGEERVSHFWQINETLHITGTCITNILGSPGSREPLASISQTKTPGALIVRLFFFFSSFWHFLWFYVCLLPSSKIGFKLKITKIEASSCLLKSRAWRLSMGSRKTVSSLPSLLFHPLDWKSGEDMDVFIFSEILPFTIPWQFLPAVATVSLPPFPAHRQVLEFSAEWMTFWLVSNHTRNQPSLPQGFF